MTTQNTAGRTAFSLSVILIYQMLDLLLSIPHPLCKLVYLSIHVHRLRTIHQI